MKKIILFALFGITIICFIITLVLVNKKSPIYFESFDSNIKVEIGHSKVLKCKTDNVNATVYYCSDIKQVKKNIEGSKYFVKMLDDKYIMLVEGYYCYCYFKDDFLYINDLLSSYYDYYFPCFTEKRMIKALRTDGTGYYLDQYSYEKLQTDFNDYFVIKDKDSCISFFKALNNNISYYDEEADTIYLKRTETNDFSIHISFYDSGINIYAKINS